MACVHPKCLAIYCTADGHHFSRGVPHYEGQSMLETMNTLALPQATDKNHGLGVLERCVLVPCGTCIGCRHAKARAWALRLESELLAPVIPFSKAFFCTLTYDDGYLPSRGSLVKKDLQDFFKRLRSCFCYYDHVFEFPPQVRYFASGEYGERFKRPHYHIIFFTNLDFNDLKLLVQKNWSFGLIDLSPIKGPSALAYTSGYCSKKLLSDGSYSKFHHLEPEFIVMSRRPGLGCNIHVYDDGKIYLADGFISKAPLYNLKKSNIVPDDSLPNVSGILADFDRGLMSGLDITFDEFCNQKESSLKHSDLVKAFNKKASKSF